MRDAIKHNVFQGLIASKFVICTMAVVVLIAFASIDSIIEAISGRGLLNSGFSVTIVINALSTDSLSFATPLLAAIPMSAIYVEDIKSNFIRYYLFRSSRKAYIVGRLIGCFLSGSMVLLLGVLLAHGTSALVFLPREVATEAEASNSPGLRDTILAVTPFVLSGGFWAVFGLTMSAFMESKYIAYSSSFIAFYIMTILHERYVNDLFVIAPKEWLHPSSRWIVGSWGPSIVVLELTLLSSLLFAFKAERRLRQL